jgi:magnesium chelatase family protein
MKIAKVKSCAVFGLDAFPVEVEVDIGRGPPSFSIVGLPDKAIDELKDRVRSAIKNSNLVFLDKRLTVNLAPADIKKEGPAYDSPSAIIRSTTSGEKALTSIDIIVTSFIIHR